MTIKTDILEVRIRGFLTEPYYFLGIPWFSIQTASVIVIMKIDITLKCICINELRTDFMIGTLPGL